MNLRMHQVGVVFERKVYMNEGKVTIPNYFSVL